MLNQGDEKLSRTVYAMAYANSQVLLKGDPSDVQCSLCIFLGQFRGSRMIAPVWDCDRKLRICNAVAEIGAVVP